MSVSDKSGLVDLASGLSKIGYKLLASGGTAKTLTAASLQVRNCQPGTSSFEKLRALIIMCSHIFSNLRNK